MQFASNLVGILQKMCLTHSATSETRTLALDIMELFLAWHDMLESHASADDDYNSTAVQEFEANRTPEEDSSAARSVSNGSLPAQPDLLLPESRRETIVGLLLRMLCLVFDFVLKSNLGPRALELLQRYLDAAKWPPMHLRLTFFERSIQQIEALGMNQQLVQHILTVLSAVTSQMQAVWFEEYFGVLATMVRKCVVVDDGQVQKLIATMLRQLYEQAAANERLGSSPAATDLRAHIEALVNKNLQDGTNTFGTLLILHSIGEFTGEQLYSYIPLLMKHVQKYTKEHNTHAPALATAHETDGGDPFALLERKYLSLVLEVYNDPRFTRSEMTMRLEQAFLSGMQSEDSEMRSRFLSTFDANMPPALPVRLNYLLETQSWESVASTFWLQQCLPLLFASTLQRGSHLAAAAAAKTETNGPGMEVDAGDMAEASLERNGGDVGGGIGSGGDMVSIKDIMGPLSRMVLLDTSFAYQVWVAMFPRLWQNLSSKERHDLTSGLIRLLAKPYHLSQTSARPNVIQAILDGFCACSPAPRLPPQLLRYLGQTYSAWYPALTLLEQKIMDRHEIESAIFDRATGVELGAFDALAELYTSLSASHYFYGAWKRHCQYNESHVALAYEQLDDWSSAQAAYERAQTKARAGVLPFSEAEYCLWESRWIETTKRLQSWDMLLELGLHESLPEIELEAGWRTWDWNERQTQVRQLLK
ncbi:transcription-associated protein 1, partial [Coemansia sp. Cherry 401B]